MNVKTQFSIKDLENLSNVKAHTIRIWEKRYNLLQPERTDTNIRQYDLLNLKKLLNVTFLYNEGLKISKIAKLSEEEINNLVLGHSKDRSEEYAMSAFKEAMLDFNTELFSKTYKSLLKKRTFREVFFDIFLPLLNDIGTLWQTGTIDPSHERFISELIKQKIIINTEQVQQQRPVHTDFVFSLYLPYEEIHEIGLLYANYEILSAGYQTIYLGSNIPLDSLKFVTKHYKDIIFLSYFTVKPDKESLLEYTQEFNKKVSVNKSFQLWLMGYKTSEVRPEDLADNFTIIPFLSAFIEKLETLKKS